MRSSTELVRPILVCLDETPRATQTLRFAIDSLIHTPQEEIHAFFSLPPTTSTLLKNKVTIRLKSFLTLMLEKYTTRPNVKLYILDNPHLMTAIQDLCVQISPRMLVMGDAQVSFLMPSGMHAENKLQSGTGALGKAYYATEYMGSPSESPVLSSGTMSLRPSYGSLSSGEHDSSTQGDGLLGLGALWNSLTNSANHAVGRKASVDASAVIVPEGKSAYIVEGVFAESVKECVPVPVVIVKVNVHCG
ncbi:UNVERIFIED_CONTAM: hypothetical protein HDU68_007303 [Siphonaria sp. JEL0065]|nr:hypothetical protein HDU68_007303 [Siphonaria sp. JEL0065]